MLIRVCNLMEEADAIMLGIIRVNCMLENYNCALKKQNT